MSERCGGGSRTLVADKGGREWTLESVVSRKDIDTTRRHSGTGQGGET